MEEVDIVDRVFKFNASLSKGQREELINIICFMRSSGDIEALPGVFMMTGEYPSERERELAKKLSGKIIDIYRAPSLGEGGVL